MDNRSHGHNNLKQHEPVDPRRELLENPTLRHRYYAFMEQYGNDDPDDWHTNIVAHGITTAGEVVLARQRDHDFELASFSFSTYAVTQFTKVEPQLLGYGDLTEVRLDAYENPDYSGRYAELRLARGFGINNGNSWQSGREPHEGLRDMRLVTMHLAHLAEDDQAYPYTPPRNRFEERGGDLPQKTTRQQLGRAACRPSLGIVPPITTE